MKNSVARWCFTILVSPLLLLLLTTCSRGAKVDQGRPQTIGTQACIEEEIKGDFKVYVENSLSMYGYMSDMRSFSRTIYSYLSDIQNAGLADTMSMYLINNETKCMGSEIRYFVERLKDSKLQTSGGDIGSTDISNLLSQVLNGATSQSVSMLISDFIFSPRRVDPNKYLDNQQVEIKSEIVKYLKKFPTHSFLIYHLESDFDGTFYDIDDKGTKYTGNRPYYIWILGDDKMLKKLIKSCPPEKFQCGIPKNSFSISRETNVRYCIELGSGDFTLDRKNPCRGICDAKLAAKGKGAKKFTFQVKVDFSKLLLDDSYLLNVDNYKLSDDDFILKVQSLSMAPHTHRLSFSSPKVKRSKLEIQLLCNMPQWIEDIADTVGLAPEEGKTFGFKNLVQGVYDAYTMDSKVSSKIIININQ